MWKFNFFKFLHGKNYWVAIKNKFVSHATKFYVIMYDPFELIYSIKLCHIIKLTHSILTAMTVYLSLFWMLACGNENLAGSFLSHACRGYFCRSSFFATNFLTRDERRKCRNVRPVSKNSSKKVKFGKNIRDKHKRKKLSN